jgi:predicted GH43/DUF377 family glycosyl hydrolase
MIERQNILLKPDVRRVLLQYFKIIDKKRITNVINRIMELSEEETELKWNEIIIKYGWRHKQFEPIIKKNFEKVAFFVTRDTISEARINLIGSYFSKEYSIEAAALFNPSIVLHPDQTGLNKDEIRFVMSLRATGEGHISSIEFRTGIIKSDGKVILDDVDRFISPGNYNPPGSGEKYLYRINFRKDISLTERVLFPSHKMESNGMENARFVKFIDDDKETYYGTYTAYDGKSISINLIETEDFNEFKIYKVKGKESKDKGMALFPRKINGKYKMISRQDGENIFIMESKNLFVWGKKKLLFSPRFDWDFIQLGNCGSPLEIDEGWLLITHGVGPFRNYVMSVLLLDKLNPENVIGYLPFPLIQPDENEREGYVPYVVYSCGSIIHNGILIIPYAMSDSATSFASFSIKKLMEKIKRI